MIKFSIPHQISQQTQSFKQYNLHRFLNYHYNIVDKHQEMKDFELKQVQDGKIAPLLGDKHIEQHIEVGEFLKSLVYGGLDGTINILTIIMSSVVIQMQYSKIISMGVAVTLGDAIGMGLGDYVSYQSQQSYVLAQREREEYEFEHMYKDEMAEMELLLKDLHFNAEDCHQLSNLYSTKQKVFIDLMLLTELGLVTNNVQAWKVGLVNFSAFVIFGLFPIIPCFFNQHEQTGAGGAVLIVVVGIFQLFGLGYMKAYLIGSDFAKRRASGFEILTFGTIVVIVGTFAGSLVEND